MSRRSQSRGSSFRKWQKDVAKKEKRQKERKGKPSGQLLKTLETVRILKKAMQAQTQIVNLKPLGRGQMPKITSEVLAKLKKLESTSFGKTGYVVVHNRSTNEKVVFEVTYGFDLTSKKKKFIGTFEIYFKNKTIRRVSVY